MRIFIGLLLLLIILLIVIPGPASVGQSGIIVNNADTIRTVNPGVPSADLAIQARIAVQYGNSIRPLAVATLPTTLEAQLTNAGEFIMVQYVNSMKPHTLAALPAPFQEAVAAIAARIAFQSANGNRAMTLAYPKALINDTAAPVISNITGNSSGNNGVITWTTDEFTRYLLRYGMQSGNYTESIESSLYAKQHSVTLPNLVAGQRYYFQITSLDRSDNQVISGENSLLAGPTPVPTPIPTPIPTLVPTPIPTPVPTPIPTPIPTATPSSVFLPLIEKR